MDAKKIEDNNKNQKTSADKPAEVSTNPELGIKRIRTFADDLAAAKARAGVPPDAPHDDVPQKPKKEKPREPVVPPQPMVKPQMPAPKHKRTTSDILQPEVPDVHVDDIVQTNFQQKKQPSREYIEDQLARSGIVTEHKIDIDAEERKTSTPAIRTYKNDAAESIEHKDLSQISIVAAEQNKRAREKDFSPSHSDDLANTAKNVVIGIVSLVFVASGFFAVIFFYNKSKIDDVPAPQTNTKEVVQVNTNTEATLQTSNKPEFVDALSELMSKAPSSASDISRVDLQTTGLLGTESISAKTFLETVGAPSALARSVEKDFFFGFHGGPTPSPYLIFSTRDFDTTFRGMLDWESSLSRDLAPLYGDGLPGVQFEDVIMRNKDTRVLYDERRQVDLLYAFPNTNTIVITTSADTFFEIFTRMSASNSVRN